MRGASLSVVTPDRGVGGFKYRPPLKRWKRIAVVVAGVLVIAVIPVIEYLPFLEEHRAAWVIGCAIAVGALFVFSELDHRRRDSIEEDVRALAASFESVTAERFLFDLAPSIFREGAWRISVYTKVHDEKSHDEILVRIACAASDADQKRLAESRIKINRSSTFGQLFSANLADPRFRRVEQVDGFNAESDESTWDAWRSRIFGQGLAEPDGENFRARKYAWYGAQDPTSGTIIVTIAESASPEGIAIDALEQRMTVVWMFFTQRLSMVESIVRSMSGPDYMLYGGSVRAAVDAVR